MASPVDVFISCAPEDDDLCRELEAHLAPLKRDRIIRAWHARLIMAAADWRKEKDERLGAARVVVLLVSASYMASDLLYEEEMTFTLARAAKGEALAVPVLVRAHDWESTLFKGLTPLPRNKRPVTSWANRDEAWTDVATALREAIEALSGHASRAPANALPRPIPRYEDEASRTLARQLEDAYTRQKALRNAKAGTVAVDAEILDLRRRLREGGRLRAGDTLGDGRYLLLDILGKGGFASVWKAVDRENGEEVAIKVLHPEMARDESRRERFFRGARVMAGLGHEAVVRVLCPRGDDAGYLYFVMELVAGGDLQQAVVEGRLARERALAIILGIGDALAEAHAKGIVHRDVKPANILLDIDSTPRLADFDLVAVADTTGGTRTGAMGTFLYAAPELLDRPQDADARADVYALAMTGVFTLYGKVLPISMMKSRPDQIIDKLSCDAKVKAALKRAVAWERDDRFADARAFCEALRAAVEPPPAPAKPAERPRALAVKAPDAQGKPKATIDNWRLPQFPAAPAARNDAKAGRADANGSGLERMPERPRVSVGVPPKSATDVHPETRQSARAQIEGMTVRYKSATIDEYIEHHAYNVSCGGTFIKTPSPFPPGTLLKGEIRIQGEPSVLAWVGRVVWKRESIEAGKSMPTGMGVKFIRVYDSSKAIIQRLVEAQAESARAESAGAAKAEAQPAAPDKGRSGATLGPGKISPKVEDKARAGSTVALGKISPKAESKPAPAEAEKKEAPPPEDRGVIKQAAELLKQALGEVGTSIEKEMTTLPGPLPAAGARDRYRDEQDLSTLIMLAADPPIEGGD